MIFIFQYEFSKKIKIEEKVKHWIDRKNKNLEIIQEKLKEDFDKVHTFAPNVQSKDKSNAKRKFDQFWEDQINHKKKIKEKVDELQKIQNIQTNSDYQSAPKINKNSAKIVEEKLKNEQPNTKVYERLYQKRNESSKLSALLKPHTNENSCKSLNPTKKTEDRVKILYEDAIKRQNKMKEIQNRKSEEKIHKSSSNSNRYILKKFQKIYKENVEILIKHIIQGDQEDIMSVNQPLNKINLDQILYLMLNMNFITKDDDETLPITLNFDIPLSSSKNIERKLVLEMFENLKDIDGLVNLDHLFIFCLSILNLLEYYIVKSYFENNPGASDIIENNEPEEITPNSNSSQKYLNSVNTSSNLKQVKKTTSLRILYENDQNALENILQKLNYDLNSRIVINKKYGGIDIEGNFIITFTHSKLIFKDFNLLALNYNALNFTNKKIEKNITKEDENKFKPKINPNSKDLGNKYRQKIIHQIEDMKNKGKILIFNSRRIKSV